MSIYTGLPYCLLFAILLEMSEEKIVQVNKAETNPVYLINRLYPEAVTFEIADEILNVTRNLPPEDGIEPDIDTNHALEYYHNPRIILLVVKDQKGSIIGYCSALPYEESYTFNAVKDTGVKEDPDMFSIGKTLLIESIAIADAHRNMKTFLELTAFLKAQAIKDGYTHIATHARIKNKLSSVLLKKFNKMSSKVVLGQRSPYVEHHTVKNFFNSGEEFAYIILPLED